MKALAQVFSSHRHVGESEAYYKICPELHLSHSSVQTVYVDTNVRAKRTLFLRKDWGGNTNENEIAEDDD